MSLENYQEEDEYGLSKDACAYVRQEVAKLQVAGINGKKLEEMTVELESMAFNIA